MQKYKNRPLLRYRLPIFECCAAAPFSRLTLRARCYMIFAVFIKAAVSWRLSIKGKKNGV